MIKKLKEFSQKIQDLRAEGGKAMIAFAQKHLQGHINYYAVSGNTRRVEAYVHHAARIVFKWLNRRSQRVSTTWEHFSQCIRNGLFPKVRIVHHLYPVRL
jgi:hypothetical protein